MKRNKTLSKVGLALFAIATVAFLLGGCAHSDHPAGKTDHTAKKADHPEKKADHPEKKADHPEKKK
jgi:hypothetical protein